MHTKIQKYLITTIHKVVLRQSVYKVLSKPLWLDIWTKSFSYIMPMVRKLLSYWSMLIPQVIGVILTLWRLVFYSWKLTHM